MGSDEPWEPEDGHEQFKQRWDPNRDYKARPSDEVGTQVKELASKIPTEIRRAVRGVNGDLQYAIVVLLSGHDGMAFSELKSALDTHQQTLSNALDDLQNASIIRKHEKDLSERYAADYRLTSFGEQFFVKLFESLGSGEGELVVEDHYIEADNISGAVVSTFASVDKSGKNRDTEKVDMVSRDANMAIVD